MNSIGPTDPTIAAQASQNLSPAGELRRQWRTGQATSLEVFLAAFPAISPHELAAVLRIDMRQRWRQSERPTADEYLARFPALATDSELALDVIYAEFLAREELGEQPVLADFQRRFPAVATVLADQVQLGRAFDGDDETAGDQGMRAANAAPHAQEVDEEQPKPQTQPQADYEVLEEIGRGGMGVVYKARQCGLNRLVALKMVRAADCGNAELLARFRAEAEVVASLHHPRIVETYDYGEHDGLPYLAMELVEGGTLAARLNGVPWSPRRAATLIAELARAVQVAHERGIVHRDLKPANLLITSATDDLGFKIADFGLAKVFRDLPTANTQSGALLGTPSYMAPEQAQGRARNIGPASDIYSLGAILYELLSGRPPFHGETPIETLRQVLTAEPLSIDRLMPRLPRDLATICTKCLSPEPHRRYASAAELADDLARFLTDQPIHARRAGNLEHGWRWCRRNPTMALALSSVAALLVTVAVGSTWYSSRLSEQLTRTQHAEQAERQANHSAELRLWDAYLAEITARNASRQVGQRFTALDTVERAKRLLDTIGRTDQRIVQLRDAALASLSLPDLRRVRAIADGQKKLEACALSLSADLYVVGTPAGEIVCRRLTDGREIVRVQYRGPMPTAQISRDGKYVAAGGDEGTQVWRLGESEPVVTWEAPEAEHFVFAPEGTHAAVSTASGGMQLIDVASGATVRSLGRGKALSDFSFHAATGRIAVCGPESVQVISSETGAVLCELPALPTDTSCLAWHPGGQFLAIWNYAEGIVLWDLATREKELTFPHRGYPLRLHFNDDGSRLVSYSLWDHRLLVWDVGSGQKMLEAAEFDNYAADVSADGNLRLLQPAGATVELWELAAGAECRTLAHGLHRTLGMCLGVAVSPDSRILALSLERGMELWDLHTQRLLATWPCGTCLARFDDQGNLIIASEAGIYRRTRNDRLEAERTSLSGARVSVARFAPPVKLYGPVDPYSLAMNRAGNVLVFQGPTGWNVLHVEGTSGKVRLETRLDPRKAAVSNDGRLVAIANWEADGAGIWDSSSGALLADLPIGRNGTVHFSPDGRLLATTPDGVLIWRVSDRRLVSALHACGTIPGGLRVAFSPDSRVLAVGDPNGAIRLADPETGHDWGHILHADLHGRSQLAFSPDQTKLVVIPFDEYLPGQVWDLTALRRELATRGLDWPVDVLMPDPSSSTAVLEVELGGSALLVGPDPSVTRQAITNDIGQWIDKLRRAVLHESKPARQ